MSHAFVGTYLALLPLRSTGTEYQSLEVEGSKLVGLANDQDHPSVCSRSLPSTSLISTSPCCY